MSFAGYVNFVRPVLPDLLDAARFGLLDYTEVVDDPAAPSGARNYARRLAGAEPAQVASCWLQARTFFEGPKVFAFDALTCEALENFTLSVPAEDYRQPFPCVVIQLPEGYAARRVVPFEDGGGKPDFLIVGTFPVEGLGGVVLLNIHMSGGKESGDLLELEPGKTLEELLGDSRPFSSEGIANLRMSMLRLALNVCLLATNLGARRLGPANPSHFKRLAERVRKNKKHNKDRQDRAELQAAPVLYAFDREVTLFHKEPGAGAHGGGNGEGAKKAPHWRRGHWRSQPVGEGRRQRKLVMIPSVLVNADRFLGAPSDTTTTYRVPRLPAGLPETPPPG
jgi:hypothetical protein